MEATGVFGVGLDAGVGEEVGHGSLRRSAYTSNGRARPALRMGCARPGRGCRRSMRSVTWIRADATYTQGSRKRTEWNGVDGGMHVEAKPSAGLDQRLERRAGRRVQLGVACRLLADGRGYEGTVRLLSRAGLLVEVPEAFPLCDEAIVAFDAPGGPRFVLETRVADPHPRSHSLFRIMPRRLGLRIQDPPQAYRQWVEMSRWLAR